MTLLIICSNEGFCYGTAFFLLYVKRCFAFFLSIYSANSLSEEKMDKAEQCVSIKSNINRLACFDKVFNTPVREQMIDDRVVSNLVPKLVGDIFTLAKVDGRDAWD